MDITPLVDKNIPTIKRYGAGAFVLSNEESYNSNIVITPGQILQWSFDSSLPLIDQPQCLENCKKLTNKPSLVLLGIGEEHMSPTPEFLKAARNYDFNVEVMNTGAACRTYNVLLGEGRDVAAMLVNI